MKFKLLDVSKARAVSLKWLPTKSDPNQKEWNVARFKLLDQTIRRTPAGQPEGEKKVLLGYIRGILPLPPKKKGEVEDATVLYRAIYHQYGGMNEVDGIDPDDLPEDGESVNIQENLTLAEVMQR